MKGPRHGRGGASERGFATVLAATLALVLCLVGGLAAALGEVVLARQQAGSAADLAALSGATAVLGGSSDAEACGAAGESAEAARAEVVSCRMDGADVVVDVAKRAPPWIAPLLVAAGSRDGSVHASARAGPPSQ